MSTRVRSSALVRDTRSDNDASRSADAAPTASQSASVASGPASAKAVEPASSGPPVSVTSVKASKRDFEVQLEATGIVTATGEHLDLDVVVFSTGYDATDGLIPYDVRGRDGSRLADVWRDFPRAYLGTTVPGFPNFFVVTGPNTGRQTRFPNEDSIDLEFTDANLFNLNRFNGRDRQEGGTRVDGAIRGAWDFPNGGRVEAIAGRSFRLRQDATEPTPMDGPAIMAFLTADVARWRGLIKAAKLNVS